MNTCVMKKVGLAITLVILVLVPSAVSADECDFWSFGGVCEEMVIESGERTYREWGYTVVVNHYEEEWGAFADIVAKGYWLPEEGQYGVRWDLEYQVTPANTTWWNGKLYGFVDHYVSSAACEWEGGLVQGFVVTYRNGRWEDEIITDRITISDELTCSRNGGTWDDFDRDGDEECMGWFDGYWGLVFETVHLQEIVGLSGEACEYYKSSGARWFDSRDEILILPFEDIIIEPWEKITIITHFWETSLALPFPCASVTRSPYPRAMVGQEAYFTVSAEPITASSDPIDTCTPDITSYQLHIRLLPSSSFTPVWYWDERPFSAEPTVSSGWSVSHTWQTASYSLEGPCSDLSCDKPLWGPSLIGEWLPAYRVNVTMAYDVQVRRTWTDWYGRSQDTGWEMVDLRQYGYNTPNLVITGARDVTPPQPGAMGPYALDFCLVPVPVIESQSLLSGD